MKGEILGRWDDEWSYTWEQLLEPPAPTPKGIQFILKEKQKRLIGGPTSGMMVSVSEKCRRQLPAFAKLACLLATDEDFQPTETITDAKFVIK